MATKRKIKIAPSILSADFSCLGDQVGQVVKAGADYIHVDVMDGHFVPNISIGIPVVESLRRITSLPLDVHLMIDNPEMYIERFASAGANIITVHVEVCVHLDSTIKLIKKLGLKAGVSLNPATPLSAIEEILPLVNLVLVMSVNPGFGGQQFIRSSLDKIGRLRKQIDSMKANPELKVDGGITNATNTAYVLTRFGPVPEIEVDGGITSATAPAVVRAGADVLVAGSAIFSSNLGIKAAFHELRNSIC